MKMEDFHLLFTNLESTSESHPMNKFVLSILFGVSSTLKIRLL